MGNSNSGRSIRKLKPAAQCKPGYAHPEGLPTMTLAIQLSDQQAKALAQAAERLNVSEAELAAAAVRDLVTAPGPAFEAAAARVLRKNQELYRRLA